MNLRRHPCRNLGRNLRCNLSRWLLKGYNTDYDEDDDLDGDDEDLKRVSYWYRREVSRHAAS